MSRWTHAVCLSCYGKREPGRRPAQLMPDPDTQLRPMLPCCLCLKPTNDGIWYRMDPADCLTAGQGPTHEEP